MKEIAKWRTILERQASAPPLQYDHGSRGFISGSCHFHSHQGLEIVYHPTGQGVTRMKDQPDIVFKEGSAVIYAPEQVHDQRMFVRGEDLCIQIILPKKKQTRLDGGLYIERIGNPLLIQEIESLAHGYSKLSEVEQSILNLRATSVLMLLVQEASRRERRAKRPPAENHVVEAERYIRENFQSIGLLDEVARHVGISHDRLRHVFREVRGKPLIRYVNEVRMERAKSLLIHSPFPLKQVATMCGYKDEYYFSAVFRKFTSQSAGVYRKGKNSIRA